MGLLSKIASALSLAKPPARRAKPATEPGFYNGRHYTEYVEEVKSLKREGRLEEAERLLLALITATKAEARAQKWEPAPWYEDQLAIVYRKMAAAQRKEKDYKALVKTLERCERRWPGTVTEELQQAREKAQAVLNQRKMGSP